MADKKISQLGATSTPVNPDLFAIVQGGVTKKITYADLSIAISSSFGTSLTTGAIPYWDGSQFQDSYFINGPGFTSIKDGSYLNSENDNAFLDFGSGNYASIQFGNGSAGGTLGIDVSSTAIDWSNGSNSGAIQIRSTDTNISHTSKISIDAPTVNFPQATASRVPYFDALSNLVSSSVTPTELGYVSGATSNIQAQISALVNGVSSYKNPCLVATTGNVTLSGEQTIDGETTSASSVFVWKQTNPIENGIYTTSPGPWTRRSDFDNNSDKIAASVVFIEKGTLYKDSEFLCSSDSPVVVGTDPITFIYYPGTYLGTTNRITVTGNAIDISASYVGQSSITTLGTVATGTWQASVIGSNYGGAGSINGLLKANGSGIVSQAIVGTDYVTGSSTNTFTNKSGNISQWTNDSNYLKCLGKITTDSSSITGSTSPTLLNYILIPANTVSSGRLIEMFTMLNKTGNNGAATQRLYLNTSASLSGATQIAQAATNATSMVATMGRIGVVKSSTNTTFPNTATASTQRDLLNNGAVSAVNIDWTVDQYLIDGTNLGNAADTMKNMGMYCFMH